MKHSNTWIALAAATLLPAAMAVAQTTPGQGQPNNSRPESAGQTPAGQQGSQGQSDRDSSRGMREGSFSSMDSNGDGRLSRSEAASDPALSGAFSRADRNSDGYLDDSEYRMRNRGGSDSDRPRQDSTTPSNPPGGPGG